MPDNGMGRCDHIVHSRARRRELCELELSEYNAEQRPECEVCNPQGKIKHRPTEVSTYRRANKTPDQCLPTACHARWYYASPHHHYRVMDTANNPADAKKELGVKQTRNTQA
jgi:hypothetical protein